MIRKIIKDYVVKFCLGGKTIPRELLELHNYFRLYRSINFKYDKKEDFIIAESTDFKFGSIITSGKDEKELDSNIKDAIMTSFDVPSSYAKEAKIYKEKQKENAYALA